MLPPLAPKAEIVGQPPEMRRASDQPRRRSHALEIGDGSHRHGSARLAEGDTEAGSRIPSEPRGRETAVRRRYSCLLPLRAVGIGLTM